MRQLNLSALGVRAALLACLLPLSGCGGDSDGGDTFFDPDAVATRASAGGPDAPTDASVEEFCDSQSKMETAMGKVGEGAEENVEAFNKAGEDLEEVGTPEGITDEEREGFEVQVSALKDFDEDAFEALEEAEDEEAIQDALGVSSDDQDKATAFNQYVATTCA